LTARMREILMKKCAQTTAEHTYPIMKRVLTSGTKSLKQMNQ